MSNELVKTIRMPLKEPTKRKEKRIEKCMKETKKIQQKISELIWSVPKYRWGTATDSVWFHLVKNNIDHVLPAHSAYQASYTVRESLASFRSNNYQGNKPKFNKATHIYFDHGQPKFDKSDSGNYTVKLPLNKDAENDDCTGWGTREWFVLNVGEYQAKYLDQILNENLGIGSGKLIKKKGRYELHQTIKMELSEVEDPQYIVGVDIGRNNFASVGIIDKDGNKITALPPWKSKFIEEHRNMLNRIRKARQESGNFGDKLSSNETDFVEQKTHEITGQIITGVRERLGEEATYKVIMEDLTGIRENLNELRRGGDYVNREEMQLINSWPYSQFQDFLEYKVLEDAHTEVEVVDPAKTSQRCSNCGNIDRNSRRGIKYECVECGYECNADINAAFNIAIRSLKG